MTSPQEQFSKTLWPTIGATRLGRLVGRLCGIRVGVWFLTLGTLMAVLTIPLSLAVYFWQLMPGAIRRYRLTSRRVLIQKGLSPRDERAIGLDGFDAVEIEILPGQAWLRAGDLVFRQAGHEVFRLSGVSRPEVARELFRKAQFAFRTVGEVTAREAEARKAAPAGIEPKSAPAG